MCFLSSKGPYFLIVKITDHTNVFVTNLLLDVNWLTGESLFTFFASLAYVPLFLLDLQNRLFLILKELHKISFVWKYGANMSNSFSAMRA